MYLIQRGLIHCERRSRDRMTFRLRGIDTLHTVFAYKSKQIPTRLINVYIAE